MKRRSRSSPPTTIRVFAEPGTPGPFTSDLVRDQLHKDFPGASPTSTPKSAVLRKQLFHSSMVLTRNMAGISSTLDQDTSSDSPGPQPPVHQTPPDQPMGNLILDEAPREPRQPRKRDPPDLQDVVTQQTEILAGMLTELRARQALPAAPVPNQAEPPADPNFNWARLVLPPETFKCLRMARYIGWPHHSSLASNPGGKGPTRGLVCVAGHQSLTGASRRQEGVGLSKA